MTPRPAAQISEQSGLWCDQGVFIPIAFSPALLVHLNATDKDIHDEVKRVLREIRKLHHPSIASPPKRKAGQYSLNTLLDEKTFKRWRDNKIVQFASLLMWRASLDEKAAKPYKNKVLGEWLELPSEKETSEAKATLKNALANLPALLTQITLTQTTKGVSSLNSSPANWPV